MSTTIPRFTNWSIARAVGKAVAKTRRASLSSIAKQHARAVRHPPRTMKRVFISELSPIQESPRVIASPKAEPRARSPKATSPKATLPKATLANSNSTRRVSRSGSHQSHHNKQTKPKRSIFQSLVKLFTKA